MSCHCARSPTSGVRGFLDPSHQQLLLNDIGGIREDAGRRLTVHLRYRNRILIFPFDGGRVAAAFPENVAQKN